MKECGITRKDLAKRVGWTPKKMKRVLGGDRISMKQMCKLLLAMGYHAKITAEAGCSHFRSPAVQPVKEDLDKGSVPPSGVDLICKTLIR